MTTERAEEDARGVRLPATPPGELPRWWQVLDYGRMSYNAGRAEAASRIIKECRRLFGAAACQSADDARGNVSDAELIALVQEASDILKGNQVRGDFVERADTKLAALPSRFLREGTL